MNKNYIVDGTNICLLKKPISIIPLFTLLIEILNRDDTFFCIFDANTRWKLKEVLSKDDHIVFIHIIEQFSSYFAEAPGGKRADDFILLHADRLNDPVISNDRYRDFENQYPWVKHDEKTRLVKAQVMGNHLSVPDWGLMVSVNLDETGVRIRTENLLSHLEKLLSKKLQDSEQHVSSTLPSPQDVKTIQSVEQNELAVAKGKYAKSPAVVDQQDNLSESIDEQQIEYYEKLTSALNCLAAGMKSYIQEILEARYKEAWKDNISRKDGHLPKLDDPYILLATIDDRWNSAFSDKLNVKKTDIEELRGIRNDAVHHDPLVPFSAESVNSSINKMLHLMKKVPASQSSKKSIEKLERLKYRISQGTAAEVSSLNIQEITDNPGQADILNDAEPVEIRVGQLPVSSGDTKLEKIPTEQLQVSPADTKLVEIPAEPLPVIWGDLRIETVYNHTSKWLLLHIFDGEKFIGIYEKSKTKEQAEKKRVEIPCAVAELREAFKKNGEKPFIVEWNTKLREKQIKSDGTKSATILGTIPEPYWWTNSKRCEKCKIPGPYCR